MSETMEIAWRDWYCRTGIVCGLPFGAGLYSVEGWLGVGVGAAMSMAITVVGFARASIRDGKARMHAS